MLKLNTTKVYADLLKIKVDLEFQPIPDPSYIQTKLIECSVCQDVLEKIFLDATQELSEKDCLFRTEQYNVECKKRDMLTNNDKIKKIPTGKEREAAADSLLENEQRKMLSLENDVNTLRDVLGAIKLIQVNVNRKSNDLKMMVRLMEQQVGRLGIGMKNDPGMSEMAQNLAELNKLASEMTAEDVETVNEFIESDESADESEAAATKTPTATDSRDSEDDAGAGVIIAMDDVLADESEAEATKTPTATDSRGTESEQEPSTPKEAEDDIVASFLTDILEDEHAEEDTSEEDTSEGRHTEDSKPEKAAVKPVAAPVVSEDGTITIRGEVDLDLEELGISIEDDTEPKKQPAKSSGTKKAEAAAPQSVEKARKSAVEVPPEKPSSKPGTASTNKKEEKPPVQTNKPTNVSSPPTNAPSTDASEIDIDGILDLLR